MAAYRDAKDIGFPAINLNKKGKATPNPCRPSMADFRADVEMVIENIVPDEVRILFVAAHTYYDSVDAIDIEINADKVMGKSRHVFEQRVGAEFLKRHIYPLNGKNGYFTTTRRKRG